MVSFKLISIFNFIVHVSNCLLLQLKWYEDCVFIYHTLTEHLYKIKLNALRFCSINFPKNPDFSSIQNLHLTVETSAVLTMTMFAIMIPRILIWVSVLIFALLVK